MKQLLWKLILPLTIISFTIFSKWWYVHIIDGSDEILTGFPLPYMCRGWHTSLSLQIFVLGLIIDLLTYFAFWFMLTFIIHQFIVKIKLNKTLTIFLLIISGFLSVVMILIGSNSDNIYTLHMDFESEIHETGYKFIWEKEPQHDYSKYHPEMIK
ncbi:hypothetical protein [Chryseotalea sanaruensis]|uniref:hypothetical protein n=1 Tax=Chryseotalea sanaruensis TaxID=2482724 RepID=UPI000F8E1434|nr:hypothetical protein [Chryseotalea sanaruensis]